MALMAKAIFVVAAVLAVQLAEAATDYPVGGDGSWDAASGAMYAAWAAKQKILQGDSISFKYSSSHDVAKVTKADYDACSGANPIKSYTGGSTTVKLTTPGKHYFICSIPGHCAAGMKLEVTVAAAATGTGAPAPTKSNKPRHQRSVAPTPAPAEAPAVPSSTEVSTPTAAPPPGSSDAATVGGMIGAKAVMGLAATVALAMTM
ncbi:hypothetical protein PR202_ga28666 [Eleusine coracana subsp. coracana]|uniref:Phytocyanin domain-containing protein n=1 Tax=Eleusine coracana subsp. coracana TaxID=191504 RepID=A0AAV5DJF2_ELECO|nr:hypothetical protein QOZ80_7AG0552420 [Eleusine coracana subsp. coracana]GJN10561.1 hypothetical protein PR202_ga28666 [Eleusine coracana subsp. coracana]